MSDATFIMIGNAFFVVSVTLICAIVYFKAKEPK